MGWFDGGLNRDPDSNIFDSVQNQLDKGINRDRDSNVLDTGLNGEEGKNVIDTGITGEDDSNIASFEGMGDFASNLTTSDILNDAGQGAAKFVTGEDTADDAAAEIQDLYVGPKQFLGQTVHNAVEGTAADNWVTDATVGTVETGAEWIFEAPLRGATQMVGIDPKTGEAVERTDGELAADTALTVGTMGSGTMLKGILKGGGKGLSKVDDLMAGSDDAVDFSQRTDGLIGQSNSIDDAATKVDVDPRFSGHAEDLKSAGDLSFLGTKTTREGAEETSSAWSDVLTNPTAENTADVLASGSDELSTAIRGAMDTTGQTLKSITSTKGGKVALGTLGVGTGVALAGTGLNAIGVLPDLGEEVATEVIEVFEQGGQLVKITKGETVAGYVVVLGRDEELGLLGILSTSGDVRRVPPKALEANFESQEAARDAYHSFVDQLDNSSEEGPMGLHNLPQSSKGTGGLDVPGSADAGQPFTIAYSLVSDVETGTTIKFGLSTQSGIVPLGSESLSFGAGEELSGTVDVPRGATSVSSGEYPVIAFAMDDPLSGVMASTTMQITGSSADGDWDSPEVVQDLDHGWVLLQQAKSDGSDVRFVAAAKNSSEQTVYLHPDGQARPEPYTYSEPDGVAEAMATYSKRVESGSVDEDREADPSAGRPSIGNVNSDLDAYDEHSVAGMASRVKSAVTSGPVLMGLGVFGLVLVALVILR